VNVPPALSQRVRQRGQSGVSLMEVLVGIAVMIPLTLSSAMGLMVTVGASQTARTEQELQIALSTATENLKAMPYLECGSPEKYQELYRSWVTPIAAKVVDGAQTTEPKIGSVSYWEQAKGEYRSACTQDDGAQRLTVTVQSDDQEATGTIVKRDGAASVRGD
jgi:Tfp pilus assembly protein PilV